MTRNRRTQPVRSLQPAIALELIGCVVFLIISEIVSDLWQPLLGNWLHVILMAVLIWRGTHLIQRPEGRLFLAMAVLPLVRIVSFAVSPTFFPGVWFYSVSEILILMGGIAAAFVLRVSVEDLGLRLPRLTWVTPLVLLSGFAAGWAESHIISPQPVVTTLSWSAVWLPSLMLIATTGFVEEFVFRGLLQSVSAKLLGPTLSIVFTAVVWSVLHTGWLSFGDVMFVLVVGLLWSWMRTVERSIWTLTLAHGIANVMLFVIIPNWPGRFL
ncbi:MAG: CPBP family intramembrane glutamic endopeptidase [Bacilli bacterium]